MLKLLGDDVDEAVPWLMGEVFCLDTQYRQELAVLTPYEGPHASSSWQDHHFEVTPMVDRGVARVFMPGPAEVKYYGGVESKDWFLSGFTVAWLHLRNACFEIPLDSPLVLLAHSYGVQMPQWLHKVRAKRMRQFLFDLQRVVTNALFLERIDVHIDLSQVGRREFFFASLVVAAHGGMLTASQFLKLYTTRLLSWSSDYRTRQGKIFNVMQEFKRAEVFLSHAELVQDTATFDAMLKTPFTLLNSMYDMTS